MSETIQVSSALDSLKKYINNGLGLVLLYKDLTKDMKSNAFIKHAMQVRSTTN